MFGRLHLTRKDVGLIFDSMDAEGLGEVSYEDLFENLRMSQLDDTRKSLTMLRLQTAEISRCCKKINVQHRINQDEFSRQTTPCGPESGTSITHHTSLHQRSMSTQLESISRVSMGTTLQPTVSANK